MRTIPALVVDVVLVLAFAIIGRTTHGEDLLPLGIATTAWPFLVGAVLGSLLASRIKDSWWRSGLIAWAFTLIVGVALRLLSGDTAQGAFVIVAAIVLALFLIGWRALVFFLRRPSRARTAR